MNRGVLYVVWGDEVGGLLDRSLTSLKRVHPSMPVHVERLDDDASLLDKSRMADMTPFSSTLYLDADTIVFDDLAFGFEQAERHGLACAINECPWGRRYPCIEGDILEYNTGVLFFTKAARPIFDRWAANARVLDSSITWTPPDGTPTRRMLANDQAGFARAIYDSGFNPYVLPLNWNLRKRWHWAWFGPLKVWHGADEPPNGMKRHNELAHPMIFTTWKVGAA